jgi:hypothetical protein
LHQIAEEERRRRAAHRRAEGNSEAQRARLLRPPCGTLLDNPAMTNCDNRQ